MNKHRPQSGSAHLIIIVVLVFALLGGLGFVFWQNIIQSEPVATQNDTNTENKVLLTEIAFDQTYGTGLSFKYPKTWGLTHPTSKFVSSADTSTIASPDGKVSVIFELWPGGMSINGTPGSFRDKLIKFDTGLISGYPSALLVSYIEEFTFEKGTLKSGATRTYDHYTGIINNSEGVRSLKVGDISGTGFFSTSRGLLKINNPSGDEFTFELYVDLKDTYTINGKEATFDQINEAMATDDYKTAKQIIQSLYVKE